MTFSRPREAFSLWGGQISTLTTGQIWMLIDTTQANLLPSRPAHPIRKTHNHLMSVRAHTKKLGVSRLMLD